MTARPPPCKLAATFSREASAIGPVPLGFADDTRSGRGTGLCGVGGGRIVRASQGAALGGPAGGRAVRQGVLISLVKLMMLPILSARETILAAVAACNTVQGAGEDVSAAGDAVSDAARDAKN